MISRMILVGLVAVLGVSLPSRSESGGWLTSAHDWVMTQLAEWDTYTPEEDGCFIVTEEPDPLPQGATQATAHANTTASFAFDFIPVANDLAKGLADELNRLAKGLDTLATTNALAESPSDFVAVSSSDSIELKLAVELRRIAEASASVETLSSKATPRPREAASDPAIDEIFADSSQVFAPTELGRVAAVEPLVPQPREAGADIAIDGLFADVSQVFAPTDQGTATIAQPEPAPIAARPIIELVQPLLDLETDIAAELNRFAEGIAIRLENAWPRPVRIRTFELIKVPADLESGIAYELNRASEGLGSIPPEARKVGDALPRIPASEPVAHLEGSPNHGEASIGKALSLSRDAAFAWMNVLTGMTPVTMTSR